MASSGSPPATRAVAVVGREGDSQPIGAGFVVDQASILTSRHVVCAQGEDLPEVWVAFPKADTPVRTRIPVARIVHAADAHVDVSILELAEHVPAGIGR